MSEVRSHGIQGVPGLHFEEGIVSWHADPVIVVVSGPSGAGKDSVIAALRRLHGSLHWVVTATSRPPRPDEEHGRDYYFFSREEFERRVQAGEFLEHATVYGDYKGVPRWEITDALAVGQDAILRVDVQGAVTLRQLLPEAVFVYIVADSVQEHLRRLKDRGADDDDAIAARYAKLQSEFSYLTHFDYLLINHRHQLEECAQQLLHIVNVEKMRLHPRCPRP